MKGALGFGAITLGFMSAALGAITMAVGIRRRDGRIMATGRQFVFMLLLGAVVAAGAMEWALVTHDFSIAYVVRNHARATPLLYTVAALWGALEGSILLWGLVPFLRTRGYHALPVHFLGKAATFNLLYAFPLLLLGDGEGVIASLADVFGWAFAIWGTGLYWWAGILYAWQVRKLLADRDRRAPTLHAR